MGRKSLLGVILVLLLLVSGTGVAGAAVLVVDRSHGQTVDLSGLTGGLGQGWTVVELSASGSLTAQALSGCSLLVVPQPVSDLAPTEVDAIVTYVRGGGGLLVLGNADGPKVTAFQTEFGVTLDPDRVLDYSSAETDEFTVVVPDNPSPHPILQGVASFVYAGGCSLSDAGGCYPLSVAPSVDLVVTGSDMDVSYDQAENCNYYWYSPPVLAATTLEGGRAVFLGDTNALNDANALDEGTLNEGTPTANQQLLANILSWLKKPEVPPSPSSEPGPIPVTIDIRPWSKDNRIDLQSRGVVRVAVLSTPEFDVKQVDPKTVLFAEAKPLCWMRIDVDRDRDKDLLFLFPIHDLKLTEESTEATLTGKTLDGKAFEGKDKVQILQHNKCKKAEKRDHKGNNCEGNKR